MQLKIIINDENKRAIEINLVTSTNALLDEREKSENDQLVSLAKLQQFA